MGTISKNFSYREFEESATAIYNNILNAITSISVRDNVKELVLTILQPLRDAWGKPLTVSSGYRCPQLNRLVGGAPSSAHVIGAAADIQVDRNSDQDEFNGFAVKFLRENGIPFDQCIVEKSGTTQWLHIGLRNNEGEQRRQTFKIDK